MSSHNIRDAEIRKEGGNQRNMRSLYIAAMIFNLLQCFSMKLAKNVFLNCECQNKAPRLATASFREKKLVLLILKFVLKSCLLKGIALCPKNLKIKKK